MSHRHSIKFYSQQQLDCHCVEISVRRTSFPCSDPSFHPEWLPRLGLWGPAACRQRAGQEGAHTLRPSERRCANVTKNTVQPISTFIKDLREVLVYDIDIVVTETIKRLNILNDLLILRIKTNNCLFTS